jgi:hypothetical protein
MIRMLADCCCVPSLSSSRDQQSLSPSTHVDPTLLQHRATRRPRKLWTILCHSLLESQRDLARLSAKDDTPPLWHPPDLRSPAPRETRRMLSEPWWTPKISKGKVTWKRREVSAHSNRRPGERGRVRTKGPNRSDGVTKLPQHGQVHSWMPTKAFPAVGAPFHDITHFRRRSSRRYIYILIHDDIFSLRLLVPCLISFQRLVSGIPDYQWSPREGSRSAYLLYQTKPALRYVADGSALHRGVVGSLPYASQATYGPKNQVVLNGVFKLCILT